MVYRIYIRCNGIYGGKCSRCSALELVENSVVSMVSGNCLGRSAGDLMPELHRPVYFKIASLTNRIPSTDQPDYLRSLPFSLSDLWFPLDSASGRIISLHLKHETV